MLWKWCTQYASKFGKLSSDHRIEKVSFHSIPKKGNAKECSNYCTIALISHTSKVMLKILKARLQQFVKWELSDVQAGFRKGRRTRDQIASIHWKSEKTRIPKKGNAKECSNYRTIALISHASKVKLKIQQARLQQYMIRELPDVQAGF